MAEKRDLGGSAVTDYSKSPIAPERARKLNQAELDYVNGIMEEDSDALYWPSYPELAEKYEIPLRVVQEQAGKHRWVSRREQRKTALIVFKNEQTRKRWQEMDRTVMGVMQENISTAVFVVSRLLDEQRMVAERAMALEAGRRAQGEHDAIERSGIRAAETESLMRSMENVMKSSERLAMRISALPTILPDTAPAALMPTVEEEQLQLEAAEQKAIPDSTLLEVYQVMAQIEAARQRRPILIEGEVDYDDDDAEGYHQTIEVIAEESAG